MVMQATVGANVSRRRKTFVKKATCDWCHERFKQSRSDQRYCCPNCRRAACEHRKSETLRTLCDYFMPGGVGHDTLQEFLEVRADTARKMLVALGLGYDEYRHRWT